MPPWCGRWALQPALLQSQLNDFDTGHFGAWGRWGRGFPYSEPSRQCPKKVGASGQPDQKVGVPNLNIPVPRVADVCRERVKGHQDLGSFKIFRSLLAQVL
jgi:hypothetical protein